MAGTDHAWGSNHFVAGGGGQGEKSVLRDLAHAADGRPGRYRQRGRWVPTTAVDQYAATLASWFGVSGSGLAAVLPNLASFAPATLGFV